jgi:hypothetical protein
MVGDLGGKSQSKGRGIGKNLLGKKLGGVGQGGADSAGEGGVGLESLIGHFEQGVKNLKDYFNAKNGGGVDNDRVGKELRQNPFKRPKKVVESGEIVNCQKTPCDNKNNNKNSQGGSVNVIKSGCKEGSKFSTYRKLSLSKDKNHPRTKDSVMRRGSKVTVEDVRSQYYQQNGKKTTDF